MSKRFVKHATFVIERTFDATPARVFAAWATPQAKARWFKGPEEWDKSPYKLDFRIGGRETSSGGPKGGAVHSYEAIYQDIVPNERVVSTYTMHLDKTLISVSLATVELAPTGKGTKLTYTEQGAFLDGFDDVAGREHGTRALFDQLQAELKRPS